MYSTFDKASTLRLELDANAAGNIIVDGASETAAGKVSLSLDMINLAGFTPNGIGGLNTNEANEGFNAAVDNFATDFLALVGVTYLSVGSYKDISTTIDWRTEGE